VAPAPIDGMITLQISGPRFAFATQCLTFQFATLTYHVPGEQVPLQGCPAVPAGHGELVLTARSAAYTFNQVFTAWSGVAFQVGSSKPVMYTLPTLAGLSDLVMTRSSITNGEHDVLAVVRDLTFPPGTTTREIDFNTLPPPTRIPQPTMGVPARLSEQLHTEHGFVALTDLGSPLEYLALAPETRLPSDRYVIAVEVAGTEAGSLIRVERVLPLPEPLPVVTSNPLLLTLTRTPTPVLGWNTIPGATQGLVSLRNASSSGRIELSEGWLAGSTGWAAASLTGLDAAGLDISAFIAPVGTISLFISIERGTPNQHGYEHTRYGRTDPGTAPPAVAAEGPTWVEVDEGPVARHRAR
jgi:hypothetical protein